MSQPFEPIFSARSGGVDRRLFLKLAAMFAATAAGCGGSGDAAGGNFGFNGGNGTSQTVVPPIPITGRVRLQDFGGGPLTIQTAQKQGVTVNADGTFTTSVTGSNVPQLLFLFGTAPANTRVQPLTDLSNFFPGPLKGVGLYFPGVSEAFELSLTATAVALVFLTFGILTTDIREAAERVRRILALSSFSAFVSSLSSFLTDGSLEDAGNSRGFRTLKQACIDEFFETPRAKLTQEEFDQLIPQGLMRTQKGGVDEQGKQTIAFENHGFRWTTVIRQELDGSGNSVNPPKPVRLLGANVGGSITNFSNVDGLLGGGNTFGWGNLFAGQNEDPGGGTDLFVPAAATTRVRYWISGPGRGDIASQLPGDIELRDFGFGGHFLTGFYYFFLPLFDIVSGGLVGIALHRLGPRFFENASNLENLEGLLEQAAGLIGISAASDGLTGSYKTENPDNITNSWIDMLAAIVGLVSTVGSQAYLALSEQAVAAAAVAASEGFFDLGVLALSTEVAGASLILISGILAVGGLAFAGLNFSRAIRDHLRLPALVQLTEVLRSSRFDLVVYPIRSEPLDREVVGNYISDNNDVFIHKYNDVDGGNAYIWRPTLAGVLDPARELVGPLPNSTVNWEHKAFINSNGYVAYQGYASGAGYITMVRRGPAGEVVELDDNRVRGMTYYPRPLGLNNENVLVGVKIRPNDPYMQGQLFTFDLSPGGSLELIDLASKLGIDGATVHDAAINDLGQVVGSVQAASQFQGIFLYLPDGTASILVAPENVGNYKQPSINNVGQVVYQHSDGQLRIIDLQGQLVRQLTPPTGLTYIYLYANALNDAGQVVGEGSGGVGPDQRGASIFWDADGTALDLTDATPAHPGRTSGRFSQPCINNPGVILGRYQTDTGREDIQLVLGTALLMPRPR
jgi:hypothetical protein